MFYISSEKGRTFGVTDTRDGVEEFYSGSDLVYLKEDKKLKIYGLVVYNHKAECTVIKQDIKLKVSELNKLVQEWRKLHNPWTGAPVEHYLAQAKIGTKIIIDYEDEDTEGRKFTSRGMITRLSYDEWKFVDENSTQNGEICDTEKACYHLEVCAIYMRKYKISIV